MFNGSLCKTDILDHINCVKDDNRIENLRIVDHRVNVMNANPRNTNKTGVTGVNYDFRWNDWVARVHHKKGERIYLYRGKDFFEVVCARKSWDNGLVKAKILR